MVQLRIIRDVNVGKLVALRSDAWVFSILHFQRLPIERHAKVVSDVRLREPENPWLSARKSLETFGRRDLLEVWRRAPEKRLSLVVETAALCRRNGMPRSHQSFPIQKSVEKIV
jgi:hypothetical protein